MSRIIYSLIFLATLFLVSRFVFEPANLYYELKWLDIPMHVLGGLGIGALGYAVFTYRQKSISFFSLFLMFALVTLVWEGYEFLRGVMDYNELSDYVDTVFDTINGALGVYISHFLATSSKEK
ncbi:MAG: hypothetical protein QG653_324 [Patescibacteria group bacterium]|nr:hypothetical protein [Patescibacteria group bacterium]